jgi:hypothetical protein
MMGTLQFGQGFSNRIKVKQCLLTTHRRDLLDLRFRATKARNLLKEVRLTSATICRE